MRFIVISDTHLGNPDCALVEASGKTFRTTPWYERLKKIARKPGTAKNHFHNKFLVVLGDVLDFSIAGYTDAFLAAGEFFNAVRKDRLAEEIIYVPGNHDFDIWQMVEYDANVRKRLEENQPVGDFRHAVPGIIDDRKGATVNPTLVGVKARDDAEGGARYGKLFLDHISATKTGKPLPFNFAYPNLYVVTDEGSVLLTHGQYFEMYWSLAGEAAVRICGSDLGFPEIDTIERLVALNHPLSQLACSGVGQAGGLTDVVRKLAVEVRRRDFKRVREYLNNADDELDRMADFSFFDPREWCSDGVMNELKRGVLRKLKDHKSSRFDTDYWFDPGRKDVEERRKRFWRYLSLIREETRSFRKEGIDVPMPDKMIFGHTHDPIPWGDTRALISPIEGSTREPYPAFNTGGWLMKPGGDDRIAAEVFIYESGKGFSSVSVY